MDAVAVVFFVSFRQPPTLLCGLDSPRSARCLSDFPPDRVNPPLCYLVLCVSVVVTAVQIPHSSTPTLALQATTVLSGGVLWSTACRAVTPAHYCHPVLLLPSFEHCCWKQPSPSSCGDSRVPFLFLSLFIRIYWNDIYLCLFIAFFSLSASQTCISSLLPPQIVLCAF